MSQNNIEMTVLIKKELGEFKEGQIVKVIKGDTKWGPYWRRRLKDAKTDNCCELVAEKAPVKPSKPTKTKSQESE